MANKNLRVVQFSFDVLVDDKFDTYMFVKAMEDMGITVGGRDIYVIGAEFGDDVTKQYSIKELIDDWGWAPQQFSEE